MVRFAAVAVLFALGVGGVLLADENALKELEGKYQAVALNKGGREAPAEAAKGVTAAFAGDELTLTARGKDNRAKIKVDPAKKPAHIDISPSDGSEKGKTFPGIYKVEKGELHLAFTERGDRPTEFKGAADVIYVRFKKAEAK